MTATRKTYICLYCDDVKGASDALAHCDQRPQPGEYSHVWQVHRDKMPVDEAQERQWEDNEARRIGLI